MDVPRPEPSDGPVVVTSHPGLTSVEAARRLAEVGPNELPPPPRASILQRVLAQVRDPMIMLLLGAALVTTLLGDTIDTGVILAVVVLNSAIGVVQEVRAERALAALDAMAAPHARVVRDGTVLLLAAGQVVPGDVVRLDAGDIVPADGVLLDAHRLLIDEAAMTGESVPVQRRLGEEVSAGTVVTVGRGVVEVTRTGSQSALGRIATMVAAAPLRPTPLQRRLSRLSRDLVVLAGLASAAVFVLGVVQGRAATDMLVVAVSLAVAAVPESLPAVVSVALALGAYRMARRNAIVRGLPAVETLGSVSVIASDKTGTLTEGRMLASRVWTPATSYTVSGSGYAPEGQLALERPLPPGGDACLADLLRTAVLCNDAHLIPPVEGRDWAAAGDPLEAALLALASKGGVDSDQVRSSWPRLAEEPFDSVKRIMVTRHRSPDGQVWELLKGAPESVLARLDHDPNADTARDAAAELAREGFRVLAVAERQVEVTGSIADSGVLPERGRLLGLVGTADPARLTARDVVEACRAAGVRVVMVTGDHPDTARVIAGRVGITDHQPLSLLGDELPDSTPETVNETGVFARTRPEQKVTIVRALQEAGNVVAVTGDGVNDAPALRAADIGVAMGRGGTEVARQAADLVLADDDLRTVVAAIEEGRRILTNIRSFLRYAISGGFAEVLVMVAGPLLGFTAPLLPAQILWINMLTHGIPGVAFGAEPVDPSVMERPSRDPDESVLGEGLGRQIAWGGALIALVSLAAGLVADSQGLSFTAHVFAVLGFAQLALALALRAPRRRGARRSRSLEWSVLAAAALHVAAIYAPPLQAVLNTSSLSAASMAMVLPLSALPAVVVRLTRRH